MFESHRHAYLKALGIENYMPRWQLPGAPISPQCEFIVPEHNADDITDTALPVQASALIESAIASTVSASATISKRTITESPIHTTSLESKPAVKQHAEIGDIQYPKLDVRPALKENFEQPKPRIQQANTTNTSIKPATKSESARRQNVRFALNFWRVSDDLMVVDSRHAELALPTEKLLVNLLFALGFPKELPKSEIIRWPVIEAPHQPQDANAARDTLNAFMDEKFLLDPGKYILLMGEDAATYLLDSDTSFADKLGKQYPMSAFSLTAIVTPSLCDLLQNPSLKRDTWNAVQVLRR
ncbi:hypothetical protein MAH1_17490 [Sessilibacter sp. MAH1]